MKIQSAFCFYIDNSLEVSINILPHRSIETLWHPVPNIFVCVIRDTRYYTLLFPVMLWSSYTYIGDTLWKDLLVNVINLITWLLLKMYSGLQTAYCSFTKLLTSTLQLHRFCEGWHLKRGVWHQSFQERLWRDDLHVIYRLHLSRYILNMSFNIVSC